MAVDNIDWLYAVYHRLNRECEFSQVDTKIARRNV
jgi:hypothetical protein